MRAVVPSAFGELRLMMGVESVLREAALSSESVFVAEDSGIGYLVLNRPRQLNALDSAAQAELGAGLLGFATNDSIAVVVLTGIGRAFCAGGDVSAMQQRAQTMPDAIVRRQEALGRLQLINVTVLRLARLAVPTIAALNGPAVGAGLALALACDVRIAVESATVNLRFAEMGLPGDSGVTALLRDLVGVGHARSMMLRPRTLPALTALGIGLVDEVVAPERFHLAVDAACTEFVEGAGPALRAIKRLLPRRGFEAALAQEAEETASAVVTPEHEQAVQRFMESRTRSKRS